MCNCEKKLDALIDALGFDVAEQFDLRKYNYECASAAEVGMQFIKGHEHFTEYKLTKRDTRPFEISVAKMVVSWWEDEPWAVLPENTTFNGRPDFVIKSYEVLK